MLEKKRRSLNYFFAIAFTFAMVMVFGGLVGQKDVYAESNPKEITGTVTAPDGSADWSLCYDRNVIGEVADYIVFMGYDQHGVSSTEAGTIAGYDWVELGLKKFITTEEIDSQKIILAVPLYTRLWTEDSSGKIIKRSIVSMKDIDDTIPNDVERKWDENLKQYYVEYKNENNTNKMWIEDTKSLEAKASLVSQYKLGGIAAWEKGMETDEVWQIFKNALE